MADPRHVKAVRWGERCRSPRSLAAEIASDIATAQRLASDRNDARGLAQMLRTGWFRQVHVKARRTMELRTLLTSRKTLVLKIGDVENQIRGSLLCSGSSSAQRNAGHSP